MCLARIKRVLCLLSILCFTVIYTVTGCALPRSNKSEKDSAASGPPAKADTANEQDSQPAPSDGHIIPVTYYNQSDPAWSDYLYGGYDSMSAYGCGPTALAIVVSTLTQTAVTPIDAAQWSYDNGCYSRGYGSAHQLIPYGARAYGLAVENMSVLTPDSMRNAISFDKLLVLLMGPGDFSDNGHFIIAYGYEADGSIRIADPASAERSSYTWPAETLLSQLSSNPQAAGPIWAVSKIS